MNNTMARYKNEQGEVYNGRWIEVNGMKLLSPSESVLLANGWERVTNEPTEAEVEEMERVAEIDGLKALLMESNDEALKFAEGWLSAEEYAPTKAQRQQWRARINELEGGGDR